MCSLLNSSQSTNATKFTWTTPFFNFIVIESRRTKPSFLPSSFLLLSLSVHPENANPCPMKRARMASECDHRLMNDDQWDDFWYNLDARLYQDLEHQPVPAPTKPQMTFSDAGNGAHGVVCSEMPSPPPPTAPGAHDAGIDYGEIAAEIAADNMAAHIAAMDRAPRA